MRHQKNIKTEIANVELKALFLQIRRVNSKLLYRKALLLILKQRKFELVLEAGNGFENAAVEVHTGEAVVAGAGA